MPHYRARYAKDKLLGHPGAPGKDYESPSFSFKAQFSPRKDECVHSTQRQEINRYFSLFDIVPFSEFQWLSLMSPRMAERFGARISSLETCYNHIFSFAEKPPHDLASMKPKFVQGRTLNGTIRILSNPQYPRRGKVAKPSDPQEIKFFVHEEIPEDYYCLGWSFILEHFAIPPKRSSDEIPEFTFTAIRDSFCGPDAADGGVLQAARG